MDRNVARIALLCATLIALAAPLAANAASLSRPGNNLSLVGWWTFDEGAGTTAADHSGNGNAGTLTGSPTWTNGKLGGALSFNGTSAYVDLTSHAASLPQGSSARTVSGWFKPTTNGTDTQDFVDYGASTVGSRISITADGGEISVAVNGCRYGETGLSLTGSWHHLAVVFPSGATTCNQFLLYLDGAPQSPSVLAGSGSTAVSTGNTFAYIGTDGVYYYDGAIDDVRIFDRALSASEVEALYEAGSTRIDSGSLSPGTLGDGLAAYWPLDGSTIGSTVEDVSGNGNNGYYIGSATSSAETIGKVGQALRFDGSQYVKVADAASLDLSSQLTISAWIKPNSFGTCRGIVSKYQSPADNDYFLRFSCNGTYKQYLDLGGGTDFTETSKALSSGQWYHVTGVINGSTGTIYVDGTSVGSGTVSVTNASSFVSIGSDYTIGGARHFDGTIDDVRIYSRALTTSEIQRLYELGSVTHVNSSSASETQGTTLASGLVGHWTFDGPDISGTTAYDRSGQGNNGTISGATPTIGKLGQALSFTSAGQYVATGYTIPAQSSATSFTWSAWIKQTSSGGSQVILGYRNGSTWTKLTPSAFEYGTGSLISNVLPAGRWTQATIVKNGSNFTYYEDGVVAGTASNSGSVGSHTFYIGSDPGFNDGTPHYVIDDVRIYDRALEPSEVKQLYDLGK